jgi:probable 2-oxoglutarate dehydrogenase E1 component DHKTD1
MVNSLEELHAQLSAIYSGTIGYEIAQVENAAERTWLYETIERSGNLAPSPSLQRRIASILIESEVFDHFMAKRFGQVKRYGLEGGESLMVAVDVLLQTTSAEHLVFGMAHRGRINLMVGLLGYPAAAVFHKLAGNSELPAEWPGSADVLSHLCTSNTIRGLAIFSLIIVVIYFYFCCLPDSPYCRDRIRRGAQDRVNATEPLSLGGH